eukprot:COSAG03_NODE_12854_length_528_cov_0.641026_2_plen_40_part_01
MQKHEYKGLTVSVRHYRASHTYVWYEIGVFLTYLEAAAAP